MNLAILGVSGLALEQLERQGVVALAGGRCAELPTVDRARTGPRSFGGVVGIDGVGVRERGGGIGGHRLGPVHAHGVIAPPWAAVLDDRRAELDRDRIAELPQWLGEPP